MAKDLKVTLTDQPGEGARLGEALGKAGVNIEGLCAIMEGGTAHVHVLVEDVAGARAALEGAGIGVEAETDVLVSPALPNPTWTRRGSSVRWRARSPMPESTSRSCTWPPGTASSSRRATTSGPRSCCSR